jgi:hypothetical protein
MRVLGKSLAYAFAAALVAGQMTAATAAPLPTNIAAMKSTVEGPTQVYWRGGWGGWGWGWGAGAIAGALIGGAIASSAYGYGAPGYYYGNPYPYYGGYAVPAYGYYPYYGGYAGYPYGGYYARPYGVRYYGGRGAYGYW